MGYRTNKDSEWQATLSYNFTRPVSKTKGIANTLKVALLFVNGNTMKSRALILKELGEPRWKSKGQLSCLFTALNWNHVIYYDKKLRCYVQGKRYREFLEYSLKQIVKLQLKQQHNKVYLQVMKESSLSAHFILED